MVANEGDETAEAHRAMVTEWIDAGAWKGNVDRVDAGDGWRHEVPGSIDARHLGRHRGCFICSSLGESWAVATRIGSCDGRSRMGTERYAPLAARGIVILRTACGVY